MTGWAQTATETVTGEVQDFGGNEEIPLTVTITTMDVIQMTYVADSTESLDLDVAETDWIEWDKLLEIVLTFWLKNMTIKEE